MKKIFLHIFFLILPVSVFGQTFGDSLDFVLSSFQKENLFTGLNKQLNTYQLGTGLNYGVKSGKLFFGIDEKYSSTVVKSADKNIKDEQFLKFLSEYDFVDFLKFGIFFLNNIYSDDRKLTVSESSNLNASVYTKIIPHRKISFIPFGGYSKNTQTGESDEGMVYGAEASVNNLKLSNFILSSKLKFQNEDISPRKNYQRLFGVSLNSELDERLFNKINAGYSELRRDFYFEADSVVQQKFDVSKNIQSRVEKNYSLTDQIILLPSSGGFSFSASGGAAWRKIARETRYRTDMILSSSRFDTSIEELKLKLDMNGQYRSSDFFGEVRLAFSERDEKHQVIRNESADQIFFDERQEIEKQKNNTSSQTTISFSGAYDVTKKDNLFGSIFHRKLRYDTPSEINFDDRDELLTIFRLMYLRKFNTFFNFFVNLEGSINHIVYIFTERSSNNNIKRILKLSSGGVFRGKKFSSTNTAEVSANYTVYDFEEINPTFQSFAFRQFSFKDSTSFVLTSNVDFNFFGNVKLSEQGDFKWTNFTSKPARYLQEIQLEPKLVYRKNSLSLGAGIRFFSLITYRFNQENNKEKDSEYTSVGPLSEIIYSLNRDLYIKIYGWFEFINNESKVKRELVNLNIQMNWLL